MQTTLLRIEGMTCSACVRHVEEALRGVAGVTRVEVKIGEARVEHEGASRDAMIEALREDGYEATSLTAP
jgi:copper chaperone CopZ